MPERITSLVGTTQQFSGGLFSSKKKIDPTDMYVFDWRWSDTSIINMKTMELKHPAVEFLVKGEGMKRRRWTRPFPVREYIYEDGMWVDNPEYKEPAAEQVA